MAMMRWCEFGNFAVRRWMTRFCCAYGSTYANIEQQEANRVRTERLLGSDATARD